MVAHAVDDLRRRVDAIRWYHTLDLPGGVVTPGEYDLRPTVARLPLPVDMTGMRALDVGSRDGFYAMLLLFIILRVVAPSWLPGLMIVVAVGSHAYWLARLVLLVRRGRAGGTRP